MLVLERVSASLENPPVPLKASQIMALPLAVGDVVKFGRGKDCTVRTEGPGVQATLAVDAHGVMTLTFCSTMPAPDAKTTAEAPHGLRVITPHPSGTRRNLFQVAPPNDERTLKVGDVIVFTLHCSNRTCFTVVEVTEEKVREFKFSVDAARSEEGLSENLPEVKRQKLSEQSTIVQIKQEEGTGVAADTGP
jgi:hypothetical protein